MTSILIEGKEFNVAEIVADKITAQEKRELYLTDRIKELEEAVDEMIHHVDGNLPGNEIFSILKERDFERDVTIHNTKESLKEYADNDLLIEDLDSIYKNTNNSKTEIDAELIVEAIRNLSGLYKLLVTLVGSPTPPLLLNNLNNYILNKFDGSDCYFVGVAAKDMNRRELLSYIGFLHNGLGTTQNKTTSTKIN